MRPWLSCLLMAFFLAACGGDGGGSDTQEPPTVTGFTATPANGFAPLTVTFVLMASDSDGFITAVDWDFDGNGTVDQTTTGFETVFIYRTPGIFTVFATVADNAGAKTSVSTQVSVESEPTVQVFKSRGSVQCEGGGTAPEVMQNELTSVGIAVVAFACGYDGLVHVALCGASDGRINIFEIPQSKATQAQSLGFASLSSLSSARETLCT